MTYIPPNIIRRDADTSAVSDGQSDSLNTNTVGRLKVSSWPGAYVPTVGTITSATSAVTVDTTRAAGVTVQLTGTLIGVNAIFEASADGTNFVPFPVQPVALPAPLTTSTGLLAANTTLAFDATPLNGLVSFRVRATAWSSGTATVTIIPFAQSVEPNVQAYIDPNQAAVPTSQPELTASATAISATGNYATIVLNGRSTYAFSIRNTFVGTFQVQISLDGTNFTSISGNTAIWNMITNATTSNNLTGQGNFHFDVTGAHSVRLAMTAYTSGSPDVFARASYSPAVVSVDNGYVQASQSGTWNIVNSPSTNTTGLSSFVTTSLTVPTLVKSGQGRLHRFCIKNPNTATDAYLQFFNASSAGAVTLGTTTPVMFVGMAGNEFSKDFAVLSDNFSAGIVVAATTTATGGTTVATGLIVSLGYI